MIAESNAAGEAGAGQAPAAGKPEGRAAAVPAGSTQARRIARAKADAAKLFPILKEKAGKAILEEDLQSIDPYLVIEPGALVEIAAFCRDDPRLQFDLLSLISTVDYLPQPASPDGKTPAAEGRIEVVYMLDSTAHRHRLILKVKLPRDRPRLRTLEGIWSAADWHEREAFDLMGVVFEGHHNLVRILCAEDWEGHPLRKDYVIPESYHGIKNIVY